MEWKRVPECCGHVLICDRGEKFREELKLVG